MEWPRRMRFLGSGDSLCVLPQTLFLREGDRNGLRSSRLGELCEGGVQEAAQVLLHTQPHCTLLGAEAGPCLF